MPRNRMIKPDFWADEKIGRIEPLARLMFIGLWNFCDDIGVCRANPAFIRSSVFQYDDFLISDIKRCISQLQEQGLIVVISYANESFLHIPNFLRHQKIDKPGSFRFIAENDDKILELFNSSNTRRTFDDLSTPKEKEKEKIKRKRKGKGNIKVALPAESTSVRRIFEESYFSRYGLKPVWAAKENALAKKLIAAIGKEEAEKIAGAYPFFNDPWHIKQKHPFSLLVSQIDKVRVELANPERMLDEKRALRELSDYELKKNNLAALGLEE